MRPVVKHYTPHSGHEWVVWKGVLTGLWYALPAAALLFGPAVCSLILSELYVAIDRAEVGLSSSVNPA